MSENVSMATEEEVKVREKYIECMYDFLQTCQEEVMEILNVLEWTPEHFIESKKQMVCPYDKSHVIPSKSLATHTAKCQLRRRGCTKEEIEIATSNQDFYYENAPNVVTVKLDKNSLNAVLFTHHVKNHSVFYGHNTFPATPREEEMMLSREDRLAVYEHIIQKARESRSLGNDWNSDPFLTANLEELAQKDKDDSKTPKSRLEELAAQRDFKRRRQSYRAKNVHITKKSYTQIIREVIENQTEIWTNFLKREETGNQSDSVHSHDQSAFNKAREGMDTKQDSDIDSDVTQSQYHRHEREETGQRIRRFRDDSEDRGQKWHKGRRDESSKRSSYSREDSQEKSKRWEDHVDNTRGRRDESNETSKRKRDDENESEGSLKRNQGDSCGSSRSRRQADRENSEDESRCEQKSHHKKHKRKHKKHKHKSADQ